MGSLQTSKPFMHFAKYLFLVSKIHRERTIAREDVDNHLKKMRKSIIKMDLSYTDIDKLSLKINTLVNCERKYAKFFKPEDTERQEFRNEIANLEQELRNEKEEKSRVISEHDEKIKELSDSLGNIKNKMRHLLMEKAKRHHRLKILEQKINKNVDTKSYYHS